MYQKTLTNNLLYKRTNDNTTIIKYVNVKHFEIEKSFKEKITREVNEWLKNDLQMQSKGLKSFWHHIFVFLIPYIIKNGHEFLKFLKSNYFGPKGPKMCTTSYCWKSMDVKIGGYKHVLIELIFFPKKSDNILKGDT